MDPGKVENKFKQEYLQRFLIQSDFYKFAFLLWADYYYSTEEYDRSVCTQMAYYGFEPTAVPVTAEQFHKVQKNANKRTMFLKMELSEKQIPEEISREAKRDAGRYTHEQLKEILNESR